MLPSSEQVIDHLPVLIEEHIKHCLGSEGINLRPQVQTACLRLLRDNSSLAEEMAKKYNQTKEQLFRFFGGY
jgi:hypothetical protein